LLIVEIALLTDMVKQTTIIYVKCCADWFICLDVFYLLRLFNFCLLNLFIYFGYDGEIVVYKNVENARR